MFAKRELDFEIETAFAGAKEILDYIAEQSAQAGHYAEILGLLSSAVSEQRRKTGSQGRSKLIGRLFSADSSYNTVPVEQSQFRLTENATHSIGNSGIAEGTGHWLLGQPLTLPADMDSDLIGGWDTLDLSQWENFPFNSPRNFVQE